MWNPVEDDNVKQECPRARTGAFWEVGPTMNKTSTEVAGFSESSPTGSATRHVCRESTPLEETHKSLIHSLPGHHFTQSELFISDYNLQS